MLMDIFIAISAGLFIHFGTKTVNFYYNFYHIFKYLDSYQKLNYFKHNDIINLLLKFTNLKTICINYFLIPMIKINYVFISLFTSILYTLCEDDFKNFLSKRGISENLVESSSLSNINIKVNSEFNESNEITETNLINETIDSDYVIEEVKTKEVKTNEAKTNEEDEKIQSSGVNSLLINHNFIHKISSEYEQEVSDVVDLQNSLNDKNNSSSLESSSGSNSPSNIKNINTPEIEIKNIRTSSNNLNLSNEFELINKKNVKKADTNDENLDNYLLNDLERKREMEKNILEFKNQHLKNLSLNNNQEIKKEVKEELVETIKLEEIDFGESVSSIISKYTKEGKITYSDEQKTIKKNVENNVSIKNEIKIGKKKRN
jgi:hypothetical protein